MTIEPKPAANEAALLEGCRVIAAASDVMAAVERRMRAFGDLDIRERKLLWLAAHTRWWKPCVNIGVFGPPGCGKSTMVDMVLPFFPTTVFEVVTELSPKALGYDKTQLVARSHMPPLHLPSNSGGELVEQGAERLHTGWCRVSVGIRSGINLPV